MNQNEWRPGQQLLPLIHTLAQRTRTLAPKKKIVAIASTIFPPARSAMRDENHAIDPNTGKAQDFDSCVAVAVPCVGFKGFNRPLKKS